MSKVETVNYKDLTKEWVEALGTCYWGEPDRERYHCESIEDAIADYIDACHPDFPKRVTVVAMVPVKLTESCVDADDILTQILEGLDDNYGDPDGDWAEPTDRMKEAAKQLAKVIAEDYVPWACEPALYVELNEDDVMAWVKENMPHWLEDE